jgi:hypothetical protein
MLDRTTQLKISTTLNDLSKPKHPYYHHGQILLFSALSYIGTAVLNLTCIISTPALHGMAFVAIAYAAKEAVSPLFAKLLKPYASDTMTKKAHIFLKWTSAILISKMTCALFGMSLGISQIILITAALVVAYQVLSIALKKFRKSLSPAPISKMPMAHERKLKTLHS